MTVLIDPRGAWRAILLADAAVAAVVVARVYPQVLPQKPVLPAVTYQEISGSSDLVNDGPSGLASARVQFNCWADNADAAYALGLKVKAALDGYRGTVTWGSSSPQDSLVVRGVIFDSPRDLHDETAKLYARSLDFIIWFAER